MKPLKCFLFVCVSVCCTVPIIATNIQHKVVFGTKEVVMDTTVAQDGNIYSLINFPGCNFLTEEGVPQLPVKTVTLIIPAGEEAVGITYKSSSGGIISLNYSVMPVQKPIPTSVDFEGNEFVTPNKSIGLGTLSIHKNILEWG